MTQPANTAPARLAAEHGAAAHGLGSDRVLRLIAIERSIRGLILIGVGIVLMTHTHTDWARAITDFAHNFGWDPSRQGVQHILTKLGLISSRRVFFFGVLAVAYGILEGVEGYGLWRRRRWAEYLTVVATSLIFIPEIWEIAKGATPLKIAALLVNVVIVIYLIWRLRRKLDE